MFFVFPRLGNAVFLLFMLSQYWDGRFFSFLRFPNIGKRAPARMFGTYTTGGNDAASGGGASKGGGMPYTSDASKALFFFHP